MPFTKPVCKINSKNMKIAATCAIKGSESDRDFLPCMGQRGLQGMRSLREVEPCRSM